MALRKSPLPILRLRLFVLLLLIGALLPARPAGSKEIDVEIEKFLGAQVARAFRDNAGVDNDPLLADWVTRIGKQVSHVSPRQEVPYSFTILGTDIANAFAAPAGYVFVTRGMLDSITSDDELATILAHETGHVTKRHAMQQIGGNLVVFGILASLHGDKYRQVRSVASFANVIRTLYKSREMEAQADELGLKFAWESGYDPNGLVHFFEGFDLRGRSLLAEYFDTHPAPAKRLAAARQSQYVVRQDPALRETTANGYEARGLPHEAARARQGVDPLGLPDLPPPAVPDFLASEHQEVKTQADNLRHHLDKSYRAEDIGATLKQILLINNQADARWLYVSARAYAVQARVEDIFARTSRVAAVAAPTYEALAPYANRPASDPASIDATIGRSNVRTALHQAEGVVVPLEHAARAVTTVLADLNNRFWRINNDAAWLRYGTLEGLLRYAESELSRADRASGIAWRQMSLARIRRYQYWLNDNVPENDVAKRALWNDLMNRRFGAAFSPSGPTGDATIRAALSVERGKESTPADQDPGDVPWADWVIKRKGVPENVATAMRLLVFDIQRETAT